MEELNYMLSLKDLDLLCIRGWIPYKIIRGGCFKGEWGFKIYFFKYIFGA
jgi:hypothetical protein